MPLTILNGASIDELLHSLTRDDIHSLQSALAEALHTYSTTPQSPTLSIHQPQRTTIARRDGGSTLFMPASNDDTIGVKVVSLAESSVADGNNDDDGDGGEAPQTQTPIGTSPRGFLTLLDPHGLPSALLCASHLTPFRTALLSTLLLKRRRNISHIAVFGAGAQAYWHIRLSLLLRGDDIKHVYIINRSFARAKPLLERFYAQENAEWRGAAKFSVLSREYGEYGRVLKEEVRKADAIFCCTPSVEPLFPAEYLTSVEGRRKGRLLVAIGSYKRHMCELHPEILKQAVAPRHNGHHHKHANPGGAVVVDSLTACLEEAGEVWQAGLRGDQMVEVGELVMLRKKAETGGEVNEGLNDWLARGNVIFKAVGMGLMDVVIGKEVVRIAEERGVGVRMEGL
jgi:ornithine cyclodeaminase/alanine dehydrogenase-like protein (mu-crystallin family)